MIKCLSSGFLAGSGLCQAQRAPFPAICGPMAFIAQSSPCIHAAAPL